MKFVSIKYPDIDLLKQFLDSAGNSLQTFRYFSSRGFEVLKNHVCTELLLDNENKPVAYGHLDTESGIVWLGTAVVEIQTGKGLGKMMMNRLIEQGKKNNIPKIRLSVDNVNAAAIKLYTNFGFKLLEKRETFSFLELTLSH